MKVKQRSDKRYEGFSAEERAAMKERVKEQKLALDKAEGEKELLAKIAEMPAADRALAEQLHAIVKANAPELTARTWYGMPAYAKDGDLVFFFKGAYKFKARYATLGFSDKANLDDGAIWPTEFAVTSLTPTSAEEARVVALIKQAVS